MLLKLTIAVLALCALTSGSHLKLSEQTLAKILHKSNAAFKNNPTRSLACFAEYLENINEITAAYETAFGECKTASENALSALEESAAEDRDDLNSIAASTCQLFTDCNAAESALAFFSCYQSAGNEATRTTYSIGTKAEQHARDIREKQTEINYVKDRCNSDCKIQYEKDVDSAFVTLQNCISAPATPTPTTTAEPPTAIKAILPSEVVKQAMENI